MVGPSTKADIGVHCQPAVQSHSHRGTQNLNFRLADNTGVSRIRKRYGVRQELFTICKCHQSVPAAFLRVLGRPGVRLATELRRKTIKLLLERAVECRGLGFMAALGFGEAFRCLSSGSRTAIQSAT